DLARVSRPLSQPGGRAWVGREAAGCVSEGPPLQQPKDPGAAARAAALSPERPRRRARDRPAALDRVTADPHAPDDGRADPRARARNLRSARRAPRRGDLP